MSRSPEPYNRIAELLAYPAPDLACTAEETRGLLAAAAPEAAAHAERFLEGIEPLSHEEREELYTRTFDLNPVCALEIGWHLYGEAYERGAFLVKMRSLLGRLGLPEGTELPDHLTVALPVLPRLAPEEAAAFVEQYLRPALDKMLAGFQGKDNPYEHALQALLALTRKTAAGAPAAAETTETTA